MFRFLGFLCIAAVAVAFADYSTQAKSAGSQIGGYSASDYIGTIRARIDQAGADRDKAHRQAELAKTHLPEAPDGWERRAWVRDVLAEQQAMLDAMGPDERKVAEQALNSTFGQMDTKKALKAAKRQSEEQIWEYVRGDEVILINALFRKPKEARGIQDVAMEMVTANMQMTTGTYKGYAMIQGVPFFERLTTQVATEPARDETAGDMPRKITLHAFMGDAITLKVHAHASDAALRTILGEIDFDGLNLMLDTPLAAVGRDAPDLTAEQEQQMVDFAVRARFKMQMDRSRKAEEKLMDTLGKARETPKSEDTARNNAESMQTGLAAKAGSFLTALTGGGATMAAVETDAPAPTRLQLSGGRSCLEGSSGGFCQD